MFENGFALLVDEIRVCFQLCYFRKELSDSAAIRGLKAFSLVGFNSAFPRLEGCVGDFALGR
jgi:hypothetical protein